MNGQIPSNRRNQKATVGVIWTKENIYRSHVVFLKILRTQKNCNTQIVHHTTFTSTDHHKSKGGRYEEYISEGQKNTKQGKPMVKDGNFLLTINFICSE